MSPRRANWLSSPLSCGDRRRAQMDWTIATTDYRGGLWSDLSAHCGLFDTTKASICSRARPAFAWWCGVRAVGNGLLTPDEGQAVGALLEMQRKAIEVTELEARVAELEERQWACLNAMLPDWSAACSQSRAERIRHS